MELKRITIVLTLALIAAVPAALAAGPASAANAPSARPEETAPVLTKAATPPVIDGVLDDPAWAQGLKFDAFKTFKPDYGKDASQKTEAFIAYDAENFYFAFRCFDNDPNRIKGAVCKRDTIFQDDIVFINIDTFNDRQSAFVFMLNPCGIQGDGMLTTNGNVELTFDTVWYSAGKVDDLGWTAEARIPLKSIRFPNREVLTWRILFIRFFTRTSEQVSFPPFDPNYGSLLGQAQPFELSGLKYKRVAELLPAFTFGRTQEATVASAGRLVRNNELDIDDISLTGKLGVTSDLTLDGTYNPDFSQVEADAGQVDFNQRYSLYYEEKRPFFLEGSELWQFGGSVEEGPIQSIVYTRTIVDPAFGFKLSGKVTPRDTVAAVYALDSLPGDAVDEHPDFMIGRFKHSLKDDAYIGGFYTGREAGASSNRVAGFDGRFRLSKTQTASFHLFGSLTKAPGAETTDEGHALGLNYSFSNRKWVVDLGYQDIGEDFQVDTGFVYRTGLRRISAFTMHSIYPKSKFFQKIEPFYWSYHLYDTIDDMWETVNLLTLRFRLPRNTMIRIDTLLANEVYAGQRFDISGFGGQGETQIAKSLYIRLFARRTGSVYYDSESPIPDPYQGYGTRAMAQFRYQPITQLDFSLSATYIDFYRKIDKVKIYKYLILRSRNTFQLNKYLFVRGIVEYNDFYKRMTLDGLASFTYIPGTVVHLGYGSALEQREWDEGLPGFVDSSRFHQMKRGFFFKVSYLHRF